MSIVKKRILWIVRAALFTAFLIILQASTAPFGNTILTGSLVNAVLAAAVMSAGLSTGLSVAAVSPVLASLFGIGPFFAIIPFISLGNAVFVFSWHFIGNTLFPDKLLGGGAALLIGAVLKFGTLYLSIVKFALPVLLKLPEKQAAVISAAFSFPQLATALLGGTLALAVIPLVKRAAART